MENAETLFAMAKLWKIYVAIGGFALLLLVPFGQHFLTKILDWRIARGKFGAVTLMEAEPLALADYYGKRWIGNSIVAGAFLVALAILLTGCTPAHASALIPSKYDKQISEAVDLYWPDYPVASAWKAQLMQESRLDPHARSSAGAEGLAQFMPGTWADVSRALGFGIVPRTLAEPAIFGGAYYAAKLRGNWRGRERTGDEANELQQVSYNAGLGSILAAQARCYGARLWEGMKNCLAAITGERNARETIGYPIAIAKWRALIEARL